VTGEGYEPQDRLHVPKFIRQGYLSKSDPYNYDDDEFLRITPAGYKALAAKDAVAAWAFMVRRLSILKCASCSVSAYSLNDHQWVCQLPPG